MTNPWTGVPLVGGILATALSSFLPFVAARCLIAPIAQMCLSKLSGVLPGGLYNRAGTQVFSLWIPSFTD